MHTPTASTSKHCPPVQMLLSDENSVQGSSVLWQPFIAAHSVRSSRLHMYAALLVSQGVSLHLQGEGRALHCQHGHLCGQGLSNQGSPAQSLPRGVAMLLLSSRAASYFLASGKIHNSS